jgi:EAL domain-containing protein (putative c-di-GMP-specific phosphodiesterase class I)
VQLAHHLGLRVVAEGVEDEATRTALLDLGCDLTQGFVHAVPVPAEEVVIARTVFSAPR